MRTRNKRLVLMGLVLALILGATAFAAATELTIWVHPFLGPDRTDEEQVMWDNYAKGFTAETGIKVDIQSIPWANREQRFLTAFSAGQGPDVFYLIPDHLAQFADQKFLADLNGLISPSVLDDFYPDVIDAVYMGGALYGIPILQTVWGWYYNLDLLKQAGWNTNELPTTWDELLEMSAMVKKNTGLYGLSMTLANYPNMTYFPHLWQAGGNVLDAKDNVVINSPEAIEALAFMRKFYEEGLVPRDSLISDNQFGLFAQGMIGATFGDNLTATVLDDEADFEWVIGPSITHKTSATYGTIGSFVVSTYSKYPGAAAQFVEYFIRPENLEIFLKATGYFAPRAALADLWANDSDISIMSEQAKNVVPGIIHPKSRDISQLVMPILQGVVGGEMTPEFGAQEMERQIKELMGQ